MLAKVKFQEGHHFQFEVRGMHGDIDAVAKDPKGPNPKELVLAALCGCTGTDVVDLMAKFGVTYDSFDLSAGAELTDHHPKHFKSILLTYNVKGATVDASQVAEAAKRSMHQYSGTAAMLSKACPLNYVVKVNDQDVASGTAEFATY